MQTKLIKHILSFCVLIFSSSSLSKDKLAWDPELNYDSCQNMITVLGDTVEGGLLNGSFLFGFIQKHPESQLFEFFYAIEDSGSTPLFLVVMRESFAARKKQISLIGLELMLAGDKFDLILHPETNNDSANFYASTKDVRTIHENMLSADDMTFRASFSDNTSESTTISYSHFEQANSMWLACTKSCDSKNCTKQGN